MFNYKDKELEKKMAKLSISFGVRKVYDNGNRWTSNAIIENNIYTLLGHLKPEQITKQMVIDLTKLYYDNVYFKLIHTPNKFTLDEANKYKEECMQELNEYI